MTKNQEFSRRILALYVAGATIEEALDAVLGAGAAKQVIGDAYDALRAASFKSR